MKLLRANAPPRADAGPDQSGGRAPHPQGQRHPHRQRSVKDSAQNPPGRCNRNRSAPSAKISAQRHHQLLGRTVYVLGAKHLPLANAVSDHAQSRSPGSCCHATWTPHRSHRAHRRKIFCPKFDVDLKVDDAWIASVFSFQFLRSATGASLRVGPPSSFLSDRLLADTPLRAALYPQASISDHISAAGHRHDVARETITLRERIPGLRHQLE